MSLVSSAIQLGDGRGPFANRSIDLPEEATPEKKTKAIVDGILDGEIQNIIVMVGAGLSVAAGIPDFRSPGSSVSRSPIHPRIPFLLTSCCVRDWAV